MSRYLDLPPPVRSVHFGIQAFRWRIVFQLTLRGVKKMLGVHWLPHQPSYAFDDALAQVFDRALVIVIAFHILESVWFSLSKSQIISHASHELLDAIAIFEPGETQSGVFFLQPIVLVRLHAHLLDPTQHIFVQFTRHNRVVGSVL